MLSVESLPDDIRDIYNKLNRSYFLECVSKYKADEWNQYYDTYLEYGMRLNNFDSDTSFSKLFLDQHRFPINTFTKYLPRPNLQFIKTDRKLIQGFNLEGADLQWSEFRDVEFRSCHLTGAVLDNLTITNSKFMDTMLNRAAFINSTLSNVSFNYKSMKEVLFNLSTLKKVEFIHIDLSKSSFLSADIEECRIILSTISDCDFSYAKIDYKTSILNNNINKNTNFTGVGISGIVMEEDVKSILEKNIRRIHWEEWYNKDKIYYWWKKRKSEFENPQYLDSYKERLSPKWSRLKKIERIIIDFPARLFWEISDYGSSTLRIILSFFILNIIFSLYYGALSFGVDKFVIFSGNFINIFLQTILVPFGITSIDISSLYSFSLSLVVIHVILSYVILAALVTRLAVLFQNRSP